MKGSCHCGKVSFEVKGDVSEAMECNCSHCSRKGFRLWFVPKQNLKLDSSLEDMTLYLFNKHQIKHYFCPVCGVQPFGIGSDGKGNEMAAINVRCLEGVDMDSLKINKFDGKSM